VTGAPKSGSSGTYLRTSSRESLRSWANITIAAAVNCFEIEAT